MPKKITIISQDYDGCYSIMTPIGFYAEFFEKNKKYWERARINNGVDFVAVTKDIRDQYNAFLTNITKDAAEVRVYVGSDRQSKLADDHNARANQNGSVFPALEELCSSRSRPEQPWQFEPLLLADPAIAGSAPFLRERGEAYKRIRSAHKSPHLGISESDILMQYVGGKKINSKRPLLLNQMWDAYRQNPEANELEFHFIDDRQDLIDDILVHLTPGDLPPKMTLMVSKFDYIGMCAFKEPGALRVCGRIVSETLEVVAGPGNETDQTREPLPMDVEDHAVQAGADMAVLPTLDHLGDGDSLAGPGDINPATSASGEREGLGFFESTARSGVVMKKDLQLSTSVASL